MRPGIIDRVERDLWDAVIRLGHRRMKGIWIREWERDGWERKTRWVAPKHRIEP